MNVNADKNKRIRVSFKKVQQAGLIKKIGKWLSNNWQTRIDNNQVYMMSKKKYIWDDER